MCSLLILPVSSLHLRASVFEGEAVELGKSFDLPCYVDPVSCLGQNLK